MASTCQSVVYAFIPAAEEEAMQDLRLTVPESLEENIGCLTKKLQEHYRQVAPIDSDAGKQAVVDSVRAQLQKNNPNAAAPDEHMLGMLAQSQTVDIVQLLPSTAASGFFGVNMYVDDKGQAKKLPTNARASAICTACGIPTEVRGDAFVAKVWDDQDGFVRHDLCVSDLASDAPWVVEAKARNASRADPAAAAQQLSQLRTEAQEPLPTEPLAERLPRAAAAKSAGTEAFKKADYDGAASSYEVAISALGAERGVEAEAEGEGRRAATELLLTCLTNLAMCRLRQGRPYDAIGACDRVVAIDDCAGKAWFRRGQACMELRQFGAARKNLTRAATLLPSSKEIRDEHARCVAMLAENKPTAGFGAE